MTTASQTNAAQAPAASGGPGAPKTARGARTLVSESVRRIANNIFIASLAVSKERK